MDEEIIDIVYRIYEINVILILMAMLYSGAVASVVSSNNIYTTLSFIFINILMFIWLLWIILDKTNK